MLVRILEFSLASSLLFHISVYDKYLDTSITLINDSSLFRTIYPRFIVRLH